MSDGNTSSAGTRTIRVPALARVEGEGAVYVRYERGRRPEVRLAIYEPPRFFESLLRGRGYQEVPDIVARICGICPVAYQMGCCHAIEKAMGMFDEVDGAIRQLRDLLYCGEWIESHVLHLFMLHLPDFMGCESVVTLSRQHGEVVRRALQVKKTGNAIVSLLGGRSVHPVGVCVGGFHRSPEEAEARELLVEVEKSLETMCELMEWLADKVTFPVMDREYEFVSLWDERGYPMNLGRIRSSGGLDVSQEEFGEAIEERQVSHSTALQAVIRGRGPYVVGPLARLNLNHEKLHPRAAELLRGLKRRVGRGLPWRDQHLSLLARGVETVHALALAGGILKGYRRPERSRVPVVVRAGTGSHGTEAPRGLCWHRYRVDEDGLIGMARIIPPTSQNQASIERDVAELVMGLDGVSDEQATLACERAIRNYDPCISCAVHCVRLDRAGGRGGGKRGSEG